MKSLWGGVLCLALTACGQQPQVERIDLDDISASAAFSLTPSPDSTNAAWTVAADGKAIDFGANPGGAYLSLACKLDDDTPPQLSVIRHAQSEPGAKALFALIGNGVISRVKLDAQLLDEGWRWEGVFPAQAPQFDVFTGPREIEATLPGAGTLTMAGSGIPREFIEWCRMGGRQPPAIAAESTAPPPA